MNIAVIGKGGHSKVIQDIIRQSESLTLTAILDDKYCELKAEKGLYTGPISSADYLLKELENVKFVVAIGDNRIRETLVGQLGICDEHYATLIHQTAFVSPSAYIGAGTVIMANAVLNADVNVGSHTIVNTGSIVEHDSIVEDHVHIAPNATLTGAVTVQKGAFVGAGATVIPGRVIGEWAIVGAGATVIRDVPSHSTVVGSPAIMIKCDGGEFYDPNEGAKPNLSVQSPYVRRRTTVY